MNEHKPATQNRCFGNLPTEKFYADYHDHEWAVPVHDDRLLMEMLILEGAQAGLTWKTILKRREGYRLAFHNFDPIKVASMTDLSLEQVLQTADIVRNRLKVYATRKNAELFMQIQKEFGSFDAYVWRFVQFCPKKNHWETFQQIPACSPESVLLSKDLQKRGMKFVGPTIMYAYMQAVGMVNDHITSCFCYEKT